jgi:hypothetical protein
LQPGRRGGPAPVWIHGGEGKRNRGILVRGNKQARAMKKRAFSSWPARPLQPRRRGGTAPVWIHGAEAGIHMFLVFLRAVVEGGFSARHHGSIYIRNVSVKICREGESGVGPNTTIPGNCPSDLAACCGRRQEGRSRKSKLQLHEYKVKLTDTSVGKVRRILQGAAQLRWAAVTDAGWGGWNGTGSSYLFVLGLVCRRSRLATLVSTIYGAPKVVRWRTSRGLAWPVPAREMSGLGQKRNANARLTPGQGDD